jgi:hypothetical protein
MRRAAIALTLILGFAVQAQAAEIKETQAADKSWQQSEPWWNPNIAQSPLVDVASDEGTNNACPGQPINCGDVLRPASITAGDNDYFYFTANAGDIITFGTDADGTPTVDTFIHLYNADCSSELASDDDAGPGTYSLLSFCATYTGTYVGRVRGFGATSAGNYKAFVTCSSSGGWGDNCATASPLPCGNVNLAGSTGCSLNDYSLASSNPCTGYASAGRDQVFWLTVGVGGSVNLTYTSSADASIYILSNCAALTCVAGADATLSGQPEVLSYNFTSPGSYYLILDSFGTDTAGAWTLTGNFNCGATPASTATWGVLKTIYR